MKIKEGFVIEQVGDGFLALAVGDTAKVFSAIIKLNGTGAFMFKALMEKPMSREELVSAVLSEYEVDSETASRDADGFILILRENGILDE